MEAGKNSVIYMGLISGPNKADDTCGRMTVTGTMDRGFTVLCTTPVNILLSSGFLSFMHTTLKLILRHLLIRIIM
jgi:hypothetical protein